MQRRIRSLKAVSITVAFGVASVVGLGGIAYAAIPDASSGVFHGCYNKTSGALRLVDPSAGTDNTCTASESAVTWNQRGVNWKGGWSPTTTYHINDAVVFGGTSYIAVQPSRNSAPPGAPGTSWLPQDSLGSRALPGYPAPPELQGRKAQPALRARLAPPELQGRKAQPALRARPAPPELQGPQAFPGGSEYFPAFRPWLRMAALISWRPYALREQRCSEAAGELPAGTEAPPDLINIGLSRQ